MKKFIPVALSVFLFLVVASCQHKIKMDPGSQKIVSPHDTSAHSSTRSPRSVSCVVTDTFYSEINSGGVVLFSFHAPSLDTETIVFGTGGLYLVFRGATYNYNHAVHAGDTEYVHANYPVDIIEIKTDTFSLVRFSNMGHSYNISEGITGLLIH